MSSLTQAIVFPEFFIYKIELNLVIFQFVLFVILNLQKISLCVYELLLLFRTQLMNLEENPLFIPLALHEKPDLRRAGPWVFIGRGEGGPIFPLYVGERQLKKAPSYGY